MDFKKKEVGYTVKLISISIVLVPSLLILAQNDAIVKNWISSSIHTLVGASILIWAFVNINAVGKNESIHKPGVYLWILGSPILSILCFAGAYNSLLDVNFIESIQFSLENFIRSYSGSNDLSKSFVWTILIQKYLGYAYFIYAIAQVIQINKFREENFTNN